MRFPDWTPEMVEARNKAIRSAQTKSCKPKPLIVHIPPKRSKYGNIPVVVDGITFQSTLEGNRYQELKNLQAAGLISGLQLQVKYEICPSVILGGKNQRPIFYVADFVYVCEGESVVEDTKGRKTPEYRLKRKLMKHIHGIEIKETFAKTITTRR